MLKELSLISQQVQISNVKAKLRKKILCQNSINDAQVHQIFIVIFLSNKCFKVQFPFRLQKKGVIYGHLQAKIMAVFFLPILLHLIIQHSDSEYQWCWLSDFHLAQIKIELFPKKPILQLQEDYRSKQQYYLNIYEPNHLYL